MIHEGNCMRNFRQELPSQVQSTNRIVRYRKLPLQPLNLEMVCYSSITKKDESKKVHG